MPLTKSKILHYAYCCQCHAQHGNEAGVYLWLDKQAAIDSAISDGWYMKRNRFYCPHMRRTTTTPTTNKEKKMKIRVFEAFAGYGSQAMALQRLKENYPQFDYEVVGISEIDRYALQAYQAVHGHCPNYGDISKVDWEKVPDFDLFTYSFPCTDISNAGQQKGLSKASGTRSSLLWECQRAIEIKRPQYLLMENVAALLSQKFLPDFKEWRNFLGELGYSSFTQILNATQFGVPQNRERVFMVSILGDCQYHFPTPFKLTKRLKDVLEPVVDEKYYLSDKVISSFDAHLERMQERGNGFGWQPTTGGV